jgi:hypothetical protein
MRIEKTGDYLVIKDNYNQVKHFTPYKGIFVHKHPVDANFILLSDRSKKSVKDSIRIKVSDVKKVGTHLVHNASRAILLIYVSILLDPTKSILDTHNSVDGHLLMNANSDEFPLAYGDISNEPTHVFNSYDASGVVLLLEDTPDESFSFRITNGGLSNLWLKDISGESIISYTGNTAIQQQISVGKTVRVDFDIDTGIFTITDL